MSESAASVRQLIRTVAGHGVELDEGPSLGRPIFHARVPVWLVEPRRDIDRRHPSVEGDPPSERRNPLNG